MTKLTRQNIIIYLTKIKLNFENAYITNSDGEYDLLVESWYEALSEYPAEICNNAVNNALKKAKFAPRLGDITEEIEKIVNADKKTDEELWAELNGSLNKVYEISRYLNYPQHNLWATEQINEIYKNLDNMLKLYLVNPSTLIEISAENLESLTFEKARFFKQLPLIRKKSAERARAKNFLSVAEKQGVALPSRSTSDKTKK